MKKRIISTIIVLLVLGAIFGLTLHQNNSNQVMGSVIDIISPAIAYADSDTVSGKLPPPPPPPPIK